MTERVWDKFLTEEDKAVFAASGYGARGGFGKRPAVLVIDVSYNFCGDRPQSILESIKRWPNSCGERAWAGVAPPGPPAEQVRCMTVAELHELVGDGLVEIGAHTRTHPMLSALKPAEQREEIAGSRSDLEAWLDRPVTSFAYPFGHRVSEYRASAHFGIRNATISKWRAAVLRSPVSYSATPSS